jgi:hypothetical protein
MDLKRSGSQAVGEEITLRMGARSVSSYWLEDLLTLLAGTLSTATICRSPG